MLLNLDTNYTGQWISFRQFEKSPICHWWRQALYNSIFRPSRWKCFLKLIFRKYLKLKHLSTPMIINLKYVIDMQILFATMDEHPANFKHRARGPIYIFRMVQTQWHLSESPTKNRPLVLPHGSKGIVFQQWVYNYIYIF